MADISVAELKARFPGAASLSDAALTDIIDENQAAIDAIMPVGTPIIERHYTNGYESIILLKWRPSFGDSPLTPVVKEYVGLDDERTLADDDFTLYEGTLRRVDGGTNVGLYFGSPITVEYENAANLERRRVLVELCKLDIVHVPGRTGYTTGKHSEQYASSSQGKSYAEQRDDILSTLMAPGPLFA